MSIAVMKHDQTQFHITVHQRQGGQEPGGRSCPEAMEERCSLACSACFLTEPRTTSPGVATLNNL